MIPAKKLASAVFLTSALAAGTGCTANVAAGGDASLLSEIFNRAVHSHVSHPDPEALRGKSIDELLAALDPHSRYLTPEQYQKMRSEQLQGVFGGIGVDVTKDAENPYIRILSIGNGAPADLAGLRAGDIIRQVDGIPVEGKSPNDVVSQIRGEPESQVTLTVQRENVDWPLEFKVRRAAINTSTVKETMLGDDIGYIRISSFNDQTEANLLIAMDTILAEPGNEVRGFVIDLRGNPGGVLNQAIRIADDFLDNGIIVAVGDGIDNKPYRAYAGDISGRRPIVVLMDAGSASAAEILAGALQDNGRAVILGTQSYGKGSIQTIYGLSNGGALALTTAHYFTPSGVSIQGRGITPDIRFVPLGAPEETRRREADYENRLANPEMVENTHKTTEICMPAAEVEDAARLDPDALQADGQADYQILCALEILRGTAEFTRTSTLLAPKR